MILDRLALLTANASALETRDVEITGLGTVRMAALSAGARDDFAIWATKLEAEFGALEAYLVSMRRLVLLSLVDDKGQRLFADGEDDALKALAPDAYSELRQAARELNKLSTPAETEGEQSPLESSAQT